MLRAARQSTGGASSLIVALLLIGLTVPQQRNLEKGLACPETLANDASRLQAITSFMDRYAFFDPAATVNDRLAFREKLLKKRGCAPGGDTAQYSFPQT